MEIKKNDLVPLFPIGTITWSVMIRAVCARICFIIVYCVVGVSSRSGSITERGITELSLCINHYIMVGEYNDMGIYKSLCYGWRT